MKFASLKNGSRDGQLVVVSRDLTRFSTVDSVLTLQDLLDNWGEKVSVVSAVYDKLNAEGSFGDSFSAQSLLSPLPRAYEWVDGSAYINHVVLVRKARGAVPPATLETDPLVYQGGSSVFLGPKDDIYLEDPAWGLDFESEVVVVLGDVPQSTKKEEAEKYIRLVGIANDVSLRGLIPVELQKGFGFFNSKPATAFSPVFVTPDELGDAWKDARVHLPMVTHYNNELFGNPDAGPEMHFSFADLIQHIAKTRAYSAGTILGSGTVSNEDVSRGSSCLAEKRMLEKINTGEFTTPFMKAGDTVSIEMFDKEGKSIFGEISQKVVSEVFR